MATVLYVALGGAIGSMARFIVSSFVVRHAATGFPWGTLTVNVIGCFVIGVLAGILDRSASISLELRMFLMTGVLGGFTTFSAFGLETVLLLRRGDLLLAGGYVALSVVIGIAAVASGFASSGIGTR